MIRFSCPHCGRAYVLADALAHLPLLCKGCGKGLTVPAKEPDPPPGPPPAAPPPVVPAPMPPPATARARPPATTGTASKAPSARTGPVAAGPYPDDFLSSDSKVEFDLPPETTVPGGLGAAGDARPPAGGSPPRTRRLVAALADAVVGLALLLIGLMVGEVAAGRPTREILDDAGTATKFPPTDLVIWLGSAAFFVLVYTWLGTRGWTVGGWLRRTGG